MDIWVDKIANATNRRMLEEWVLHKPQTIKATSTQDLDPAPLAANDHPSVLPHELFALDPGDPPSHTLTWKPLGWLSHVKRRTNDDRFPLALWEVWFCTQLGVPIPDLIGPLRQCPCNAFQIDLFGDHLQTCQRGRKGVMWKFVITSSCKSLRTGQTAFLLRVHSFWILP